MQALQVSHPESKNDVAVELFNLTPERLELLKRTIAQGTTDDEFALFVEICKRRKVDPFSKLLYPVKRWDSKAQAEVMAVQSSIDSFRLVAGRNDKYAGQLGPQWCGPDAQWVDVWLKKEPPAAARVGILRHDFKEPLWTVALWENYCQRTRQGQPTSFWLKMGPLMLAKCAEALGLRRAFPEDLAGLYTAEEMSQATPLAPEPDEIPPDERQPRALGPAPAERAAFDAAIDRKAAPPQAKPKGLDDLVAQAPRVEIAPGWTQEELDKENAALASMSAAQMAQARAENRAKAKNQPQSAAEAEAALPDAPAQREELNKETGELVPLPNLWNPTDSSELEVQLPVSCGFWLDWCDQPIPKASKLHDALVKKNLPPTWRSAAAGKKTGGRHALLLFHVTQGQKGLAEGQRISVAHQRAACALAILIAQAHSDPEGREKEQGVLSFG